ncbi:type IV pilus modification PilV family protein [Desmospora profundinema]|uniref:Prepilin-type N-terminal cleavage/methylation domain-containing protein n=1 Tax=Desmospora profundinema TaxID=1571184 RepID=A0ABU1ILV4_9BACL|nr:type II secretion system protein [Desmospora profundinema]MDR6224939.1 prepilin-type N-terminal cleavage/methylation domain-containing protein [Desmospora profundinema]
MRGAEKGFTLVEVVTALMVLSVILAVGIPIMTEVREQQHLQAQRMQAVLLLERHMEELQIRPFPLPQEGSTREQVDGTRFDVRWKQKRAGSRLAGTQVEVQWQDRRDQTQQLRLRALQYMP